MYGRFQTQATIVLFTGYRWSDCICAGLASKLALKFAPDRYQILEQVYEKSFEFAASTDNDGVTMRIRPTAMNLS